LLRIRSLRGLSPFFAKDGSIMIKRLVLAAVLAVVAAGTAYAYTCSTSCYWLGSNQYCNTTCN